MQALPIEDDDGLERRLGALREDLRDHQNGGGGDGVNRGVLPNFLQESNSATVKSGDTKMHARREVASFEDEVDSLMLLMTETVRLGQGKRDYEIPVGIKPCEDLMNDLALDDEADALLSR